MKKETILLFLIIAGYNLVGCVQATSRPVNTPKLPVIPNGEKYRCPPDKPINPAHTPYVRTERDGQIIFAPTPYQFQARKGEIFRLMGSRPEKGLIGDSGESGIFCETDFELFPPDPDKDTIPTYELMQKLN